MTLDEFLALPEQKPALEYLGGVVRQKAAAKPVHGSLQRYLATIFNRIAWPLERCGSPGAVRKAQPGVRPMLSLDPDVLPRRQADDAAASGRSAG
jgi:Uma2 family endonuclease